MKNTDVFYNIYTTKPIDILDLIDLTTSPRTSLIITFIFMLILGLVRSAPKG